MMTWASCSSWAPPLFRRSPASFSIIKRSRGAASAPLRLPAMAGLVPLGHSPREREDVAERVLHAESPVAEELVLQRLDDLGPLGDHVRVILVDVHVADIDVEQDAGATSCGSHAV